MKNKILILIVTLSISHFNAQNNQLSSQDPQNSYKSSTLTLNDYLINENKDFDVKNTDNYKGSPYWNPSYLLGNIYNKSELLSGNVALRYNVIADEIEVKETLASTDENAQALTKSVDIYVKIKNETFIFIPYQGSIEKGGYFQVVFDGSNYDLLKKVYKKFRPAVKAATSMTKDVPASFEENSVYFIVTKDGKFHELPKSKSKKVKVFGNKQDVVKKYIKKNKLNINKEKDLKKLLIYFDNLDSAKLE